MNNNSAPDDYDAILDPRLVQAVSEARRVEPKS